MLRLFAMLRHAALRCTPKGGSRSAFACIAIVSQLMLRRTLSVISKLGALGLVLLSLCASNLSHAALFNDTLPSSPNFNYEHELLQQHQQLVERYTSNYDKLQISKQPANKTEQCTVTSELLDGLLDNTSLLFWEGSCQNGKAEGFGRVYVVKRGHKVFEMLTNFHSDEPQFTTTYYSKNTLVNAQTVYFYGKATRYHSSGVTITQRNLNNDLVVAMQTIDKVNFITYQKETSLNSPYVLNIADFGNHTHFIYDLNDSPYRSLFMAYKLVDNTRNHNIGYSFTGQSDGQLKGTFTNNINNSSPIEIPNEELQHIINTNEAIEVNIESSIKNVIEALVVVDAYLNVICADTYQNPVCNKMECKLICDLNTTITPDHQKVKELLLRLADHHNKRPIKTYLESIINGTHAAASAPSTQSATIIPQGSTGALPATTNGSENININVGTSGAPAQSPVPMPAPSQSAPAANTVTPVEDANSRSHTEQALSYDSVEQRRQALQIQQSQVEEQLEQQQQQTEQELPSFRARETMLRHEPDYHYEVEPEPNIALPFSEQDGAHSTPQSQFTPKEMVHDKEDLTESELQLRQEIIERSRPQH